MEYKFQEMQKDDIEPAARFITAAMNPQQGRYSRKCFQDHFHGKAAGLDDGRTYLLFRSGEQILGLSGLHHYQWGPDENVWLGWFAVSPSCRGAGLGRAMFEQCEKMARKLGYKKIFVETYDRPDFEPAAKFYRSMGMTPAGRVDNYLPDDTDMLVFRKNL